MLVLKKTSCNFVSLKETLSVNKIKQVSFATFKNYDIVVESPKYPTIISGSGSRNLAYFINA